MDTIQLVKDKHTASVNLCTHVTNECTDIGYIIIQESFNVLDCGIYRVISRRGSQSDEETSSLINQSTSEEERLKEFSFVQEEDQVDHGKRSSAAKWTSALNKNDDAILKNIKVIFTFIYSQF